MGSRTGILFMSVDRQELKLPISDWLSEDNGIWQLFTDVREGRSHNTLFDISGRHGSHLLDILTVINRCSLKALDFLDFDVLAEVWNWNHTARYRVISAYARYFSCN